MLAKASQSDAKEYNEWFASVMRKELWDRQGANIASR